MATGKLSRDMGALITRIVKGCISTPFSTICSLVPQQHLNSTVSVLCASAQFSERFSTDSALLRIIEKA